MNAPLAAASLMTEQEFLALPDDGVERWLIRGRLREKRTSAVGASLTVRDRWHSRVMVRVAQFLANWLDRQPEPRGQVFCGEVGCRLRRDPSTIVGIDVAYISAEVAARPMDETSLLDGVPLLAVEILSPSDTHEEIHEKIDDYIRTGVALVWVIDPHDRTVLIYRPRSEPELVNARQELDGGADLPGFRLPVARLFD